MASCALRFLELQDVAVAFQLLVLWFCAKLFLFFALIIKRILSHWFRIFNILIELSSSWVCSQTFIKAHSDPSFLQERWKLIEATSRTLCLWVISWWIGVVEVRSSGLIGLTRNLLSFEMLAILQTILATSLQALGLNFRSIFRLVLGKWNARLLNPQAFLVWGHLQLAEVIFKQALGLDFLPECVLCALLWRNAQAFNLRLLFWLIRSNPTIILLQKRIRKIVAALESSLRIHMIKGLNFWCKFVNLRNPSTSFKNAKAVQI